MVEFDSTVSESNCWENGRGLGLNIGGRSGLVGAIGVTGIGDL